MPKISKEKFDAMGQHKGRTTDKTKYEFDLHYSIGDNIFYFEQEAIVKAIPKAKGCGAAFKACDTRNKAIAVMQALIGEAITPNKVIAISIQVGMRAITTYTETVNKEVRKKDAPLMTTVSVDSDGSGWFGEFSQHTLGLKINRFYVYNLGESNEQEILISVPHTWKIPSKKEPKFRSMFQNYLFLDWTPEREAYITSLCNNLDNLAATLLAFLAKGIAENGGDFAQFIDNGAQLALPTTSPIS